MKISVIGAGNIGGTLGNKWANEGHHYHVRNPQADKVAAMPVAEQRRRQFPTARSEEKFRLFAIPGNGVDETASSRWAKNNSKLPLTQIPLAGRRCTSSICTAGSGAK